MVRRERANLGRLAAAMVELHARLRVAGLSDDEARTLPVQLDGATLVDLSITTWMTDAGAFDVLDGLEAPDGRHVSYEELARADNRVAWRRVQHPGCGPRIRRVCGRPTGSELESLDKALQAILALDKRRTWRGCLIVVMQVVAPVGFEQTAAQPSGTRRSRPRPSSRVETLQGVRPGILSQHSRLVGDILSHMRTSAPGLIPLFRSEAQLHLLATLYVGPDRYWTITALAHRLDEPVSTIAREVNRLADSEIVTITAEGRNKIVGPNWHLPWAGALASLLDQTIGPLALLGEALKEIGGLSEAWIFGSWAARHQGTPGPSPRDVDVILVGDNLSRYAVAEATNRVADRVGLEVNPYLVTVGEWRYPIPNSFVADVKVGSLVPVLLHSDCQHG